jgi:hypothetical protein
MPTLLGDGLGDGLTFVFVVCRAIFAFFLAFVGLYALWSGFKLYSTGIGQIADAAAIEIGKIKLKLNAKTVGSVVMITAITWGALGYLSMPAMDRTSDRIKIASLQSQVGSLQTDVGKKSADLNHANETMAQLAVDRAQAVALADRLARDSTTLLVDQKWSKEAQAAIWGNAAKAYGLSDDPFALYTSASHAKTFYNELGDKAGASRMDWLIKQSGSATTKPSGWGTEWERQMWNPVLIGPDGKMLRHHTTTKSSGSSSPPTTEPSESGI